MIDEDMLYEALREAADAIEIPEGATPRILAAAQTPAPQSHPHRPQRVIPQGKRGRVALIAAAVIVVAGGISFPLLSGTDASKTIAASTFHGSASTGAGGPQQAFTPAPAAGSAGVAGGAPSAAPASPATPSLPPGSVGQSAKVVAKGSVNLTIGNGTLQSALAKLTNLVAADGGFVASTQAQIGPGTSSNSSSGTVVLQVPQPAFASLVSQVQKVGHASSVTTTSTDVTGQVVDLQARIDALQASRQQYLTILSKASTIGDILAVQSQLDSLQTQIEQLQGQLDVLNSETTYGTLTVSLTETGQRPVAPPTPSTGLIKAWHDGIGGFVSGFEWLVRIAGPALFVLLCLAALVVLGRFGWRAVRRRML
ncbi:MAG TPA: DUF4349 domain-containing protein [Acidimicrobiales bacterium]|jgi:hypothetical protein|nr:DUF4349 domain-containing protein [Acidimicrobiales bacterium]